MDDVEKAVYVYNILLKILKVSGNDRKTIICHDFLENLHINSFRELCWQDINNPLLIEIQSRFDLSHDEHVRPSFDSQGESSGSGSES